MLSRNETRIVAVAGHRPPHARSFPSSTLVPAHNMQRICSSTPCSTSWPPFCLPLFTSDGLNVYFYASFGPFRTLARGGSPRAGRAPVAAGDGPDLRPGEEKLPAAQAGASYACNAPWNKRSSQGHEASNWVTLVESTPLLLNG